MAEPLNPLIGTNAKSTVHNAKCAIAYLREWSPEREVATSNDVERGRWLLLGTVERALEHALDAQAATASAIASGDTPSAFPCVSPYCLAQVTNASRARTG